MEFIVSIFFCIFKSVIRLFSYKKINYYLCNLKK